MGRNLAERVTLAREARGYTQKALAEAIGATQGYLSKIESGRVNPGNEILAAIGSKLMFPRRFFEIESHTYRLPASFYRIRQSISARDIKTIEATANIVVEHVRFLIKQLEVQDFDLPTIDIERLGTTPEEAAKQLRSLWRLPRGPVPHLIRLLESHGVVVVPYWIETEGFDAVSTLVDDCVPPVVLVKRAVPGDRLRFSVAHELGHLVLHHSVALAVNRDVEDEANRFAAEFLAPAADITPYLRRINLQQLAELKEHWKISMGALIMRATYLGCISRGQAQGLWKQMSRLGYKKQEPVHVDPEEVVFFTDMIDVHLSALGYSESELSVALCMELSEFKRAYRRETLTSNVRPELRLI